MSTATSIASMAQQFSRGFGISIVAVLLHLSLAWRGAAALGHSDFIVAFSGATLMALCCLAFTWSLPHDAARRSQRPPAEDSRIAAHARPRHLSPAGRLLQ